MTTDSETVFTVLHEFSTTDIVHAIKRLFDYVLEFTIMLSAIDIKNDIMPALIVAVK